MCNILNWEQAHISQYKFSQTHLAPAGFWRVASNKQFYEAYLEDSIFLPYINNEKQNEFWDQNKKRFSSLNRVELVKFGADTIIYPKESTQFGSFDFDGKLLKMQDTDLYKDDTIGLKTLHE